MSVPELDADAAEERLKTAAFVDVRDAGSFRGGHIPGALHVGDHNVAQFVSSADKARPTIVYCYHGHSSLGGAAYLLEQGFTEVYSLRGGFAAWHGRPTDTAPLPSPGPAPPRPKRVEPPKRPSRRRRWLSKLRSLKGR